MLNARLSCWRKTKEVVSAVIVIQLKIQETKY